MQFQCPACSQTLEAPDGSFAIEGKCKFCGAVIISPASPDAAASLKQNTAPEPPPPPPPPSFGAAQAYYAHQEPKRGNGMALASVILGVLGIVTCGATSLPGFIFGMIALFRAGTGPENRSGRSMALAGTIISAVFLLLIPVMAAILFPVFSTARERARGAACMSNVKQLEMAVMMYNDDYNGAMPPAAAWDKKLFTYVKSTDVFSCPAVQDKSAKYKMNSSLDSIILPLDASRSRIPVLFDARPGGPPYGGPTDVIARHHRDRREVAVIGFADGHVENVSPGEVRGLMWSPARRGD